MCLKIGSKLVKIPSFLLFSGVLTAHVLDINSMDVFGVIPSRYGSSRFPGKPLELIEGRPLIEWVIENSKKSNHITKLIVATDDERIAKVATQNNVESVLTDSSLPTGTDRVWAAIQQSPPDIVVNIQGDEPLVSGELIDQLLQPLMQDSSLQMSTLATEIQQSDLQNQNTVKVILNQFDEAIYFSRFAIPYSRIVTPETSPVCLKHIGMYAYRAEFLEKFCACSPVDLERYESLEQLRALYLAAKIKVVKTQHHALGVDVPEDIEKVENLMKEMRKTHA